MTSEQVDAELRRPVEGFTLSAQGNILILLGETSSGKNHPCRMWLTGVHSQLRERKFILIEDTAENPIQERKRSCEFEAKKA